MIDKSISGAFSKDAKNN